MDTDKFFRIAIVLIPISLGAFVAGGVSGVVSGLYLYVYGFIVGLLAAIFVLAD